MTRSVRHRRQDFTHAFAKSNAHMAFSFADTAQDDRITVEAERIDVGVTWINSWFLRDLRTPFGGSKQSGIGREGGVHSLEFYTETRNVCVKL
jgi:aminomuconate-semialdehyde/2-hydroxymuconate-6-semialdehyde dehydrogenase